VNQEKLELELPSRIESVEMAAVRAEAFAREAGFGEDALSAIDMAVRESVANAVKHGNLLDETKQVEMTFSDMPFGLEIIVRDFGKGFAPEDVPDPTNPENLLKENGRGILFMRAFMDEVEWSNHAEGGMVVKMLKRR
jgi:serine/threonine-protein kinase RsbW